jgi:tetratricopeptide (TPR) repeat protein
MARLSHPNVVSVFDVGRTGDALFVAMEYVAGTTLHEWLTSTPRDWREILDVMMQAGRGLEAAHGAGIVHRDFKPANVMVGREGRPKVTDFGLAHSSGERPIQPAPVLGATPPSFDTPLTIAGAVMGTPGYMAPEQYLGQPTSPATDQYAFCATLYEAFYGQRPFVAPDLSTLARLVQVGAVPRPPRASMVPAWLFPIIERGLSTSPAARYPSMGALLADLGRDPSVRRRRLALAAAGVLAVGGLAAVLWGVPRMRVASCHRETEALATIWGHDARRKVESVFRGSQEAYAESAWLYVGTTLDTFVEQWRAERRSACEALGASSEQARRSVERRLACLQRRRVEFDTLVNRLALGESQVLLQAGSAASQLTPVQRCSVNQEPAPMNATTSVPVNNQVVDEVESALAQGRTLAALAAFDAAEPHVSAAVSQARGAADDRLIAVALLEQGSLERAAGRYESARAKLEEAARLALQAGDERTALESIALLASVIGWRVGDPKRALALSNLGRGLLPRVNDAWLEGLLEEGEGDAHWRASEGELALANYRRALSAFERDQGPGGLDVARVYASIGWVLGERGSLTEAREALEHSQRLRERALGMDHPMLGETLNAIGYQSFLLDDQDSATREFRRALKLKERMKGIAPVVRLKAQANLSRALSLGGRPDEALQLLDSVASELEQADGVSKAGFLYDRALALGALSRHADALAEATHAWEAGQLEGDNGFLADCLTLRAEAALKLGDPAKALAFADDAIAKHQSTQQERSRLMVRSRLARAKALGALGRAESETLGASKAAAEAAERLEGNARTKAEVFLQLAAASWTSDPQAARAAARRAQEVASGSGLTSLVEASTSWLETHPGR